LVIKKNIRLHNKIGTQQFKNRIAERKIGQENYVHLLVTHNIDRTQMHALNLTSI